MIARRVQKKKLAAFFAAGLLLSFGVVAACSKSISPSIESNTNWLVSCGGDADCGSGLRCACNVCTVSCEQDVHCTRRDPSTMCTSLSTRCENGAAETVSACLAICSNDDECSGIEDASCKDGLCVRRPAATCPTFSAGVKTPERIRSRFERIAGITDIRYQAWIDESGIYWFDRAGALYALPYAETTPIMLRPAPAAQFEVLRMVGDDTHLYWGQADLPAVIGPPEPGPPPPPGRLYSIPKTGGDAKLLLEAAKDLLTPLAVDGERVVVLRSYASSSLASVAKDGSSSEPLAPNAQADSAKVIEGKLYWYVPGASSTDENTSYQNLWRANLDGSNAAQIARMEGNEYLGAGDLILWRQERTHVQPLVLDQNYVMLDQTSGCVQPLPGLGLTISSDSVMDGSHVYWFSFNGLDGVSPGDPEIGKPLIRVDLKTGALEQVVTPGFGATLSDNIIGQTRDRLYVTVNGKGLVAIDKP